MNKESIAKLIAYAVIYYVISLPVKFFMGWDIQLITVVVLTLFTAAVASTKNK